MAEQHPNDDGGFYVAVPLDADDHAASVEGNAGMVEITTLGPSPRPR